MFESFLPDIDECLLDTDNCSQNCSNTIGSYQCLCDEGYRLDPDGLTCNGRQPIYLPFYVLGVD